MAGVGLFSDDEIVRDSSVVDYDRAEAPAASVSSESVSSESVSVMGCFGSDAVATLGRSGQLAS